MAGHARPLSSVLSAGRYVAQVHDGWPPLANARATSDGLALPIAHFQGADPMKTFTVQCEYPALYRNEVTVEAEDPVAACRAAIDVASESGAWKAHDRERPTYVVALAEGADVDPWGLTPEGADASILPVPGLFTDVATLAGYAATRSEDLVLELRIMLDAIGDDGRLRIDPKAMGRLCATGKAILEDVDRRGLSPKDPRDGEGKSGSACVSPGAG